ncbi:MAG: DUF2063 domain-containing protein [Myxococcales bacterium]|nr:DUF2063 domain-containing protein [Myxococcales bacterium]
MSGRKHAKPKSSATRSSVSAQLDPSVNAPLTSSVNAQREPIALGPSHEGALPLAELQRELGELLRRFEPLVDHPSAAARATIARLVSGNERLSPHEQAEIYRDQFWLRHRDSLYEDFPALSYLLGADSFEALVRAYLLACPPDSWTLRDLGLRLGSFAASYDAFSPEMAGPARELAAFELAFIRAFDAAEVTPLDVGRVAMVPATEWPNMRLGIHPHVELFALEFPVHEVRAAVREGQTPERQLAASLTFVAVWRAADRVVYHRPLAAGEYALLSSLRVGTPLGAACGSVAEKLTEPDQRELGANLRRWFERWAQCGWLVSLDAAPAS